MPRLRNLAIGIFVVSAWVSCAYAAGVSPLDVTVQGNVVAGSSLTANASVAPLPSDQSQGLVNDIGFQVTGSFTFDTSNPDNLSPSVNYTLFESITLAAGNYEASSYMNAQISDTPTGGSPGGYVQDFQVTTNVYAFDDEGVLSDLVASSTAGQLAYPSDFCQLPGCIGLSSGNPAGEGTFYTSGGTYYLQQNFVATVAGVGQNDLITITLPDTSGIGEEVPEPGSRGLLAMGMVALLFARRYAVKVTRA
jgi:hypothetical protein